MVRILDRRIPTRSVLLLAIGSPWTLVVTPRLGAPAAAGLGGRWLVATGAIRVPSDRWRFRGGRVL